MSSSSASYDLSTTRNALRAMYSLQKTADMVRAHEIVGHFQYRFVAAVRPDTAVFTAVQLPDLMFQTANAIMVPNSHHWNGINDRFALGTRQAMLDVYMQWAKTMLTTGITLVSGEEQGRSNVPKSTNTEGQLCALLRGGGIKVVPSPVCVVRVRTNGDCHEGDLNPAADTITCMDAVLVRFDRGGEGPCSSVAAHPRPWTRHCYPDKGVKDKPASAPRGHSGAKAVARQMKCRELVKPVDPSPERSPQAVHTAMLQFFANKDVVEFGTRNGDGMACFSHVTRSAVAIEIDPVYCDKLRARARQGASKFTVLCQDYRQANLEGADIFTWWQQAPHLSNAAGLAHLARSQLRQEAEAVLLFDHSWPNDMDDWVRLKPLARTHRQVAFNETGLCETLLAKDHPDRHHCPSRAHGNFTIGVFSIAKLQRTAARSFQDTSLLASL